MASIGDSYHIIGGVKLKDMIANEDIEDIRETNMLLSRHEQKML
jgi:hypothetical protein